MLQWKFPYTAGGNVTWSSHCLPLPTTFGTYLVTPQVQSLVYRECS